MSPERVCFHLPDDERLGWGVKRTFAGLGRWYLNWEPGPIYVPAQSSLRTIHHWPGLLIITVDRSTDDWAYELSH